MGESTKIQWATHTFNPWEGCTKVSPGCLKCYAETRNHRFGNDNWGKGKPRRRTSKAYWAQPHRWNNEDPYTAQYRSRVFPSLCDPFDEEVPIEWFADFMALIRATPNIDWLLLTKRPENWLDRITSAQDWHFDFGDRNVSGWLQDWRKHSIAPPNVWMGVSAEDQKHFDLRVPSLFAIPAWIRFVSAEPLLGPIHLGAGQSDLNWLIIGGESGPGARECRVEWVRHLLAQCRDLGIVPFVKQLGADPVFDYNLAKPIKDKKGGDPEEWPEDLRVREFPIGG